MHVCLSFNSRDSVSEVATEVCKILVFEGLQNAVSAALTIKAES